MLQWWEPDGWMFDYEEKTNNNNNNNNEEKEKPARGKKNSRGSNGVNSGFSVLYCTFRNDWNKSAWLAAEKIATSVNIFRLILLVCLDVTTAVQVEQLLTRPYAIGDQLKHNYVQKPNEGCPPEFLTFRRYRYFQQLCRKQPALAVVAAAGLKEAARECQFQMQQNRWDCRQDHPSLNNQVTLLHEPAFARYGYKETAFFVALSSAGVTWSIARACTSGALNTCRCNVHQHSSEQSWEWGGCSYSVKYGLVMSRKVLTPKVPSNGDELMRKVYKHNLKAGRLAVKKTIAKMCKCHGVSGSCQLKTCWKATADMRHIGDHLRAKFERAKFLFQNNSPNDSRTMMRHAKAPELVFFQRSPSFCEPVPHLRTFGVSGRACRVSNATHSVGDCDKLCCDRGYLVYKETVEENCNCRFQWCCDVLCDKCRSERFVWKCR